MGREPAVKAQAPRGPRERNGRHYVDNIVKAEDDGAAHDRGGRDGKERVEAQTMAPCECGDEHGNRRVRAGKCVLRRSPQRADGGAQTLRHDAALAREIVRITDWHVDALFSH